MTGSALITLRVDDAEYRELAVRAERDKVSLSDYIRVRLGLRAQGSAGEAPQVDRDEALETRLADHERRLGVLEDAHAAQRAAPPGGGPTG
jgi:hypothetical protein